MAKPSTTFNPEVLEMDKPAKSAWQRRIWWGAGLLLCGGVGLAMSGKSDPRVHYLTKPVTLGDLSVTVSATGTLAPLKEVEVGIEVSGTVESVAASYNDVVKTGQVLAKLDTTRLAAQASQAQAALASAQAKIQQTHATVLEAEAQMARLLHVKALSGGKVPSQYDLTTATAALTRAKADEAAAQASAEQAKATLAVNRTDLGKATVKSPINGVVLKRSVEPGQTVAAQFTAPVLFTLAEDLTQMELQVDVDEADVGQVQAGQQASFTVDAYPDRHFPAQITQVRFGSETVDGVVTYKTVLRVDNAELVLRPGMTATATITVNQRHAVRLVDNSVLNFMPPPEASEQHGSFIDSILPHPPKPASTPTHPATTSPSQTVWRIQDGKLQAITVTKGASNGLVTEIIGGDLAVGSELVFAQESAQ